ncbi:tetratricopeptide repeat protein [Streptomyces sp. B6B3]|uniref:ATP-binding protein n=1 Tax=Streptomyces sp. B6B3 TaxID=3153570 RepID=UPI00325EB830
MEDVQELARSLTRRAAEDPVFGRELRRLVMGEEGQHTNLIGESAQVLGPSVQARDIAGGVHFHQAPTSPPPPSRPVPRQLLPVPATFTGRQEDLRALDALRDARDTGVPQIIVVSGPGGVGKTTLTSRYLRDRQADFPDGQLYADLRGFAPSESPSAGEVLGHLLRSLGEQEIPATLPEQTALWRSTTAGLRFALMLDNASTAAHVRTLLPSAPDALVVVTSRHRLSGLVTDGAVFHQLGLLDDGTAMELLARSVGRQRVDRDRSAALEIVTLCAFLPLAVCLAAARLASRPEQPIAALAAALTRGTGPIGALRAEGTPTVQTVLDESYGALTPEQARTYRRLGLLPVPDFDVDLAAAACDLEEADAERLLEALAEANLLEETPGERYRFHDLVRAHAAQRGARDDTEATRHATARRLVDWCLARASAADRLLAPAHRSLPIDLEFPPAAPVPFTDERGALAWSRTHHETLMSVLRAAAEAGWPAAVWQLTDAMWPAFARLRGYESWIEAHRLGLAAARGAGERGAEMRMLTSGAKGLVRAGQHEEAREWYERALVLAREADDPRDEAQALSGLGTCSRAVGRLAAAEEYYRRALALREAVGDRRQVALSRLRLGEMAFEQERHGEAVEHLSLARAGLVAVQDAYDAARARALLGFALANSGRRADGIGELRASLAEFDDTGSGFWRGRALEMLGQLAAAEDQTRAREHYGEALARFAGSPVDAERVERRLRELGPAGA